MVDEQLVLRRSSELEQYLSEIREFSRISVSEYSKDWKIQRIVERTLQIMIETCLDISAHIISDEKFRTPDNYSDLFKILSENNIVESALLPSMDKMAKFRNSIVHHYDKIDNDIVVNILRNHLEDFEAFIASVLAFIRLKRQEEQR